MPKIVYNRPPPPLKWHGGKHYLADRIVALMPSHTHYVEPYFGGGSVLLAKDPLGVSEVANDIDGRLMEFWTVLREEGLFNRFRRKCEATPFSEGLWKEVSESFPGNGYVERAWRFYVLCRQSLAGRGEQFAPLSRTRTRRGMNEQASAWLSAVEGLPAVHSRLKRVAILNRDALDVIRQQDGEGTLFYLDPPYLHETRATTGEYGPHEMTETQHGELLKLLVDVEGKFLLSGYPSKLYDRVADMAGWGRVEFDLPNNAAGGKGKRRMAECVWMNYNRI